jgi:hypothetical protein
MRARPLPVTIAIVLLALLSLGNLLAPLISEGIPMAAVFLLFAIGALGIVGAWGCGCSSAGRCGWSSSSVCSTSSPMLRK